MSMAETLTTLTTPLVVRVNARNGVATPFSGGPRTCTRLVFVHEIQEEASGALLLFQEGFKARVARSSTHFATYLTLAQRSLERRQPVGVKIDETGAVLQMFRADNDVPTQVWDQEPGEARVVFQGHDGVYRIPS